MTTPKPSQVPEGSPLHAFLAEAMYDHGRWERTEPLPPTPEWTVTSPPGEDSASDPCPVDAVVHEEALVFRDHERIAHRLGNVVQLEQRAPFEPELG